MTRNLSHYDNHRLTAKSHLLEQDKNKPFINGLLGAILDPLQEIENKLFNIYENSNLNTATSYYLDRIGAIIGEDRNYRNDEDYRLAIRIRIIANNGGGTPDEIIVILRNIYGVTIRYFEYGTAYFQVHIETATKPIGINSILAKLKPLGVHVPIVTHSTSNEVFRFAESCKAEDTLQVKNSNSGNIPNSSLQAYKNELETQEIQITFDSFEYPDNSNGFAEIVIHRSGIELDDKSQYLIDKTNELETVMSYKDFIIEGGSCFAEVIANE